MKSKHWKKGVFMVAWKEKETYFMGVQVDILQEKFIEIGNYEPD